MVKAAKNGKRYQKMTKNAPNNDKSCEKFKKKLPKHLTFDDI